MTSAAAIQAIARCPACAGDLSESPAGFSCAACGQRYVLRDGVPMLYQQASASTEKPGPFARARHALLANHVVYDFAQRHGGGVPLAERVARTLTDTSGKTVLDIGGGTGSIAALLPSDARYVWLDNDTLKLRGLTARGADYVAMLGDAARLPLKNDSVDVSVMMEVSHHLPDAALIAAFQEVARVTRERFVFLDALRTSRATSRILWSLDLGRHPRTEAELLTALEASFEVANVERFRVHHDHILCVCRPRSDT
jgi:SAM-dependent methyltransferase